jgi:hypothetical protein
MAKVSVSKSVAADPARVWRLAVDLPRYGEWNTMHEGFAGDLPAELAKGSTYKQQVKLMGMPAEIAWQVTEAQEPGQLELKGDGPMGVKAVNRWVIEPAGAGSLITLEMEFKGMALAGPMGSMVEKQAEGAMETSLTQFVALLGADDGGA